MQTFLPSPDFRESARVLDRQRLGKQRVEVLQLLRALNGETRGWVNHPATKMWRGHGYVLVQYGLAVCDEWVSRGYNDTCHGKIAAYAEVFYEERDLPPWLGHEDFHRRHRSALLKKNPDHYREFWPDDPDDLPYLWPSEGGTA